MIYIELFIGFLTVGLFSFGGAYAAIPLIRDVVLAYGWIDDDTLTNMIAIGESTPGPIMVNLATYVGSIKGGLLGGLLATFAVILPAFFIILLIMVLIRKALANKYVQAVLRGLKPCITGIIAATGFYMIVKNVIPPLFAEAVDIWPLLIALILLALFYGSRMVLKKKMSPIMLIIISAIIGATVYGMIPNV